MPISSAAKLPVGSDTAEEISLTEIAFVCGHRNPEALARLRLFTMPG
jgi:predicted PhzF superfamily epimerase YddE/YHI9